MTEKHNSLWVRERPRESGKYGIRLSSNLGMNPTKSVMEVILDVNGVATNQTSLWMDLDTSDIEWLVNQMLEWLKMREKERAGSDDKTNG